MLSSNELLFVLMAYLINNSDVNNVVVDNNCINYFLAITDLLINYQFSLLVNSFSVNS